MSKKDNSHHKTVTTTKAIMIVISVLFFAIGCIEIISASAANSAESFSCAGYEQNTTGILSASECNYFQEIRNTIYINAAKSNALFCFTICLLSIASAFFYHRHLLPEEEW